MSNVSCAQVFIIGCPRSGTSALAWGLAQHPQLWTSAESDFMHELFRGNTLFNAFKKAKARPDEGWLEKNRVTYREFTSYFGQGIDALFRSRSKGLTWIDQTPGHTLIAPVLKDMFPNAKFVHIVRDGRQVVQSMLSSGFDELGFDMNWTTDFENACETWVTYVSKGLKFAADNEVDVFQLTNHELRNNSVKVISDIQAFLGIESDDASAKFLEQRRLNSSYDDGFKTILTSGDSSFEKPAEKPLWSDDEKRIFHTLCDPTVRLMEKTFELESASGFTDDLEQVS